MLRQALFGWAFNPATRDITPPPHIAAALDWAARASQPVAALDDPATVRVALGACAKTLDGKPAAGSTRVRCHFASKNDSGHVRAVVSCAKAMSKRLGWLTPGAGRALRSTARLRCLA